MLSVSHSSATQLTREAALLCECGELGELLQRCRVGLGAQHLGELVYGLHRRRHLALHRHLRVRVEAQKLGLLLAQLEDLCDERRVRFARAADEGAVQLLAHGAVLKELHGRQVGRHVESQLPRARLGRGALLTCVHTRSSGPSAAAGADWQADGLRRDSCGGAAGLTGLDCAGGRQGQSRRR